MFAIDGSIVAVALPTMMTDLDTTLPLITWTLAGYTLAQVARKPKVLIIRMRNVPAIDSTGTRISVGGPTVPVRIACRRSDADSSPSSRSLRARAVIGGSKMSAKNGSLRQE